MIATTVQRNDYDGPSAGPDYPYSFKVFAATDLRVLFMDAAGAVSVLVHGVDYTVDGVGEDAGGDVIGVGALLANEHLTIRRYRPLLQETDIRNGGPFNASIHEDAFDRAEMDAQFLADEVSRSLRLPELEPGTAAATELPAAADRANRFLYFDGAGNATAVSVISSGAVVISAWAETLLDDPDAATARATLGGICPRSIVAGSGIAVANGDGVAGNPTVSASGITRANLAADSRLVYYGPAAPTSPIDGQFWWDTTLKLLKRYRLSDTSWRIYYSADDMGVIGASAPELWFTGLRLAWVNATSFQILAGSAVDDGGTEMIRLASPVTVDLSGAPGKNSIDAGVLAPSTWIHAYLIYNPTSGEEAGLGSLSASAPTMPAGFTKKRWLCALRVCSHTELIRFYTSGQGRDKTLLWSGIDGTGNDDRIFPCDDEHITEATSPKNYATTGGIPPDDRCRWGLFSAWGYAEEGGLSNARQQVIHHPTSTSLMWRTAMWRNKDTGTDVVGHGGFEFEMPTPEDKIYVSLDGDYSIDWTVDIVGFRYTP